MWSPSTKEYLELETCTLDHQGQNLATVAREPECVNTGILYSLAYDSDVIDDDNLATALLA